MRTRARNDEVMAKDLIEGGRYYTGNWWVVVLTIEPVSLHQVRVTYRMADPKLSAKLGERAATLHLDRCWHLKDRGRDLYADEVGEVLANVANNPYCPFPA